MPFVNNPPMCPMCDGAGIIYEVEDLTITSRYPKGRGCKLCKKTGIDIRIHDVEFYKGEIIYYSKGTMRIGMFIEELGRNHSLIALGSQVISVENQYITFTNLMPAIPQKNLYRF